MWQLLQHTWYYCLTLMYSSCNNIQFFLSNHFIHYCSQYLLPQSCIQSSILHKNSGMTIIVMWTEVHRNWLYANYLPKSISMIYKHDFIVIFLVSLIVPFLFHRSLVPLQITQQTHFIIPNSKFCHQLLK